MDILFLVNERAYKNMDEKKGRGRERKRTLFKQQFNELNECASRN